MAKTTKTKPADINWSDRKNKRKNDELLIKVLAPAMGVRPIFSCLSLPGAKWFFECGLAQAYPDQRFLFTGLEMDREVFQTMVKEVPKICLQNAHFLHCAFNFSFAQFLGTKDTRNGIRYDLVYLDYMGVLESEKADHIERAFRRQIFRKGGYVAFTFMLTRDTGNGIKKILRRSYLRASKTTREQVNRIRGNLAPHVFTYINDTKTGGFRILGFLAFLIEIAQKYGYEINLQHLGIYTDMKGNINPEASFVFQLN